MIRHVCVCAPCVCVTSEGCRVFATSETFRMGCTEIVGEKIKVSFHRIEHIDAELFKDDLEMAMYYIDEFCDHMTAKRRSVQTVDNYRTVSIALCKFLFSRGFTCNPFEIGYNEVLEILEHYDVTENSMKVYLHRFGKWMRTVAGNNIIDQMDILWNDNEFPNAIHITPDEYRKMWEASSDDPLARIILVLGGRCGMRRDEMVKLRMSDIRERDIVIHGKGHGKGKVRTFPLTESIRSEIDRWIVERNRRIASSKVCHVKDELLISYNRRHSYPMNGDYLCDYVKRTGDAVGVILTTHSLRRFYITEMGVKVNPYVLARSVGQKDVTLLLRYTRNNPNLLIEGVEENDKQYIC